jgi:hypothetical protein
MQHGIRTKYHLLDPGWNYGELKWMTHSWGRGYVGNDRKAIKWYKRQFARAERRRGAREASFS